MCSLEVYFILADSLSKHFNYQWKHKFNGCKTSVKYSCNCTLKYFVSIVLGNRVIFFSAKKKHSTASKNRKMVTLNMCHGLQDINSAFVKLIWCTAPVIFFFSIWLHCRKVYAIYCDLTILHNKSLQNTKCFRSKGFSYKWSPFFASITKTHQSDWRM